MGGIYRIKPRFQQALSGIAGALTVCHVHPDMLTAAAFALLLILLVIRPAGLAAK